jgi:hypothetical protein
MTTKRPQLVDAMRKRSFVRLSRRFEKSNVRGYVLDVGPRFFLLALVSDRIWLDGFECFRVSDIKGVKPDPYASFAEKALKKRRDERPKRPLVSVASIQELLLSASKAFPLLTIHREQIDPDVCSIGQVLTVSKDRVSLLEISPDATWERKPSEYRLSEITRVNFDGDYEKALHLVGGNPAAQGKQAR